MATVATKSHQHQTTIVLPDSRKVVDEVSGWLRLYDDGSIDRTWTDPPEALPLMQHVEPYAVPRDGHTLHDLPGEPDLRVYLPEIRDSAGRLPVIVQLHGGGFCISHPSWVMYHHFYARLACTVPAVVVTAQLPLAPEHRLPAQMDAGVDVLCRLRSIVTSDAGTLEDPAAELLREDGADVWAPLRVAGGVPIHPGFVRATRSKSELEETSDSVFFTLDMADKFIALALPEGATKDHPYTCPMGQNAPPLESVPLPPMLLVVAEKDLIRDTNLEYYDALRAAGKEVGLLINRDMSHSFYLNKFAVDMDPTTRERAQELIDAIKGFIAGH